MSGPRILVVDDKRDLAEGVALVLSELADDIRVAYSGEDGLEHVRAHAPDLLVSDIKMPGLDGVELLRRVKEVSPRTRVILLTAYGTIDSAVQAMKLGAFHYLTKPFDSDELLVLARRALKELSAEDEIARLKAELAERSSFCGINSRDRRMHGIFDTIRRVAPSSATVLVRGESGTGKELVARAIHDESPRRAAPFVKIHCAALPDNLLESELFGYEKGAFTGAAARKPGRIELADGGTVFLDEIGDISPATQVKLLRVLQDKQLERLGGTATLSVDVRFVTATHRDLEAQIRQGLFREDLFYRLNVVPIWLPPLRARTSDVDELARAFFAEALVEHGRADLTLAPDGLAALAAHPWPGNVRQLKNVVERIAVLAPGPVVGAADVERELARDRVVHPSAGPTPTPAPASPSPSPSPSTSTPDATLGAHVGEAELQAIKETLARCGDNRTVAARLLGISRRTLYNKLARHGLA